MKYEVRCGCGKAHPVSAADAGTTVRCGCGKAVEVPPLHQLRATAGEETLSPAVTVQSLLLHGKLPGTTACAVCGRDTPGLLPVAIQCEWAIIEKPGGHEVAASGCLGFLSGGAFGFVLMALGAGNIIRPRNPVQRGQDLILTVPVRVCDVCRPVLGDPAELRRAVRQTREYADLLDRYPAARITPRG